MPTAERPADGMAVCSKCHVRKAYDEFEIMGSERKKLPPVCESCYVSSYGTRQVDHSYDKME